MTYNVFGGTLNLSQSIKHHTTSSGYIFATIACIENWKKLLNSNISSTSSQHGELRPTSSWDRLAGLGHAGKFHWVQRLASLLHRRPSTGVNQTLHDVWPFLG